MCKMGGYLSIVYKKSILSDDELLRKLNLNHRNKMSITEIDGSVLEGGGQILRLTMALSTLLKKPIEIKSIRNKRMRKGIRPQHLKGIEMASEMCDGNLSGAAVNAQEITYYPGNIKSGRFEKDIEGSGSIALLMQVSIPIALFALSSTVLILKGGTNANHAPSVDHAINVFLPLLKKFGCECSCKIEKRGYFPSGSGVVNVQISPVITSLSPVRMVEFGIITHIWGRAYVSGLLSVKMAHEMADTAVEILGPLSPLRTSIYIKRVKEPPEEADGPGFGIVLFARTNTGCILGGSAVGKKGLQAQEVGKQAAFELVASLRGRHCLDDYMQDQIILFMALAKGKSVVKCGPLTEHTKTAIHVTEILVGVKFKIEETPNFCLLECEGIGFTRN